MAKTYRCTILVRGYELDGFGHVNNSVYLNYLEHARWQLLKEEGITLPLLQSWKRFPILAGVQARYLKPLFMGDEIVVETQIFENGRTGFDFDQVILKDGTRVFEAKVHVVTVNELGRPVEAPVEITHLSAKRSL